MHVARQYSNCWTYGKNLAIEDRMICAERSGTTYCISRRCNVIDIEDTHNGASWAGAKALMLALRRHAILAARDPEPHPAFSA